MQNLIFSLTPEDYSTSHCARLSLSPGSPGGSAGTAWLWDVVLKSFRLLTVATTSPAPRKQIFAMSSLCDPSKVGGRLKERTSRMAASDLATMYFVSLVL